MKLSRDKKRVIIRHTDRSGDLLLQGGVCGQVSTYAVAEVIAATGLRSLAEIIAADPGDEAPIGGGMTIAMAIHERLGDGKIVRRGVRVA